MIQSLERITPEPHLQGLIALAALVAVAFIALTITRKICLRFIKILADRSPTDWDNIMIEHRVFSKLSWIVPIWIIRAGFPHIPSVPDGVELFMNRTLGALGILVMVLTLNALLNSITFIYGRLSIATTRPIKGYIQVVKIVVFILGFMSILATIMGTSPWYLLSGVGAMMAIIMLIFRDTLLSLVAGVQLTSNDLVRVGDWIEMPQFGADGDVVDIALNSIKVRNWDNTITVVPTHKFLEHSFKNWRSMVELGGRRICRSINIDLSTISFLNEAQITQLGQFRLLSEYLAKKKAELEKYNQQNCKESDLAANRRRLTNFGTFRAYVIAYLRSHPCIHQEMMFLVRQMEPTPHGVPLQVYVFTNNTAWPVYEGIQADIFDHLLAMVPEFGLRVYQYPTGADLRQLPSTVSTKANTVAGANIKEGSPSLPAEA